VGVSMKKNSGKSLTAPSMRARKERLESLLSFLRISLQRRRDLVPRFAMEWGLSEEKVQEYVGLLIRAGRIVEDRDGLHVVGRKSLKSVSS
jgi:hypothetical protein